MKRIRLGTRKSKLAIRQAELVRNAILQKNTSVEVEIIGITTEGDIGRNSGSELGKGSFVKKLEEELLAGKIDAAVHSAKDMPANIPDKLDIAAFIEREDPRDVFISNKAQSLSRLPMPFKIGTSSPRRRAFLLHYCTDVDVVKIRGNVDTRIRKVEENEVDGIIIAAAGINRLGFQGKVSEYLDTDYFIPSAGQGAVAVEVLKADSSLSRLFKSIDDFRTRTAVMAERTFINEIGAGCHLPVGVYCSTTDDKAEIVCAILSSDGSEMLKDKIRGDIKEAEELGRILAQKMLDKGAEKFLNIK